MKKSLPFHGVLYHLVFLYFSTALQVDFVLHNKKITAVKDFKAAQPMRGLILDQCNEKIKFITNLCCPFSTNYRRSHQRCSMKKSFLRNFTKFTGAFCEFCEVSKNVFFTEHPRKTASIISWIFIDICIVIVNTKFVAQRHI